MKVTAHADVPSTVWDEVCARSSSAWLFHRSAWIGIESTYFPHRNLSFALEDNGEVIGVQPLYASETGLGWIERLVHSGVHRHTGLALVDGLAPATIKAARTAAMREIAAIADAGQADRIQLNAQSLAPASLAALEIPFWVADYGFHFGLQFGRNGMVPAPGMSTCCADQIVMLGAGEDQLFASLDEGCRRAVRKATSAGLGFEAGDAAAIDHYGPIAQASAVRTGESLPPRAYYEAILSALGPSGRSAVLFATHEGRKVAGVILVIDKGAASFVAGSSDPEFLPLRVNDFLHWSAIVWAKRSGLLRYRLGPFFPEVPDDWPIARVSKFKTKFGGVSVPMIQGSRFIHPEKYRSGAQQQVDVLCAAPAPTEP